MVNTVVDIVFLVDLSKAMAPCLDQVKTAISSLVTSIDKNDDSRGELGHGEPRPIDWRVAVYGFCNYTLDGPSNWFVSNPFVRRVQDVNDQLAKLKAEGGDGQYNDLLDAVDRIAKIGNSERGASEEPEKWRYCRHRDSMARIVFILTVSKFNGCGKDGMEFTHKLASNHEETGEDVVNDILQNKLRIGILAPDFHASGWNGYVMLDCAVDRLYYKAIPIENSNELAREFGCFLNNEDVFACLFYELRHVNSDVYPFDDCMTETTLEESVATPSFLPSPTKENHKMLTCAKCSHEFDESESVCPCCGWSPRTRLLLVGSAGKRSFGGRFSIGRSLIRSICGEDDARYADSSEQFVLDLGEDREWSVLPGSGKNPTFLNGKRLLAQTLLHANDILSIGLYKARMSVSID